MFRTLRLFGLSALATAGLLLAPDTADAQRFGRYGYGDGYYGSYGPTRGYGYATPFRGHRHGSAYRFGYDAPLGGGYFGYPAFGPSPGAADFDPQYYLRANPDVEQAIRLGYYRDPFEHYWEHGRFEGRSPNPAAPDVRRFR